jgi:uncharacterized protein (DUF362 family)
MKSKIILRKIDQYRLEEVEAFVRDSVSLFSPSEPLFKTGQRVLLKPNLLRGFPPEHCVTTHPVIVEAVCRVLKDHSVGEMVLSDSPAFGSLEVVARKAGYGPLVKKYGLKILPLGEPVPLATEENVPHLKIAGNLGEYDRIVNLPKFKSHCQMTLTLGIKNLFGLVNGKRKPILHCLVDNDKVKFGRVLVDIARFVNPCLTIADGIQAMQGNGPLNGTPFPLGVVAAGQDMTALDRVLAEIVQVPPARIHALQAARQKGFGNYNLEDIELTGEEDLSRITVSDFQLASRPLDISFNPLRIIKSVAKQFYETKIKERLADGPR